MFSLLLWFLQFSTYIFILPYNYYLIYILPYWYISWFHQFLIEYFFLVHFPIFFPISVFTRTIYFLFDHMFFHSMYFLIYLFSKDFWKIIYFRDDDIYFLLEREVFFPALWICDNVSTAIFVIFIRPDENYILPVFFVECCIRFCKFSYIYFLKIFLDLSYLFCKTAHVLIYH